MHTNESQHVVDRHRHWIAGPESSHKEESAHLHNLGLFFEIRMEMSIALLSDPEVGMWFLKRGQEANK